MILVLLRRLLLLLLLLKMNQFCLLVDACGTIRVGPRGRL